MYIRRKVFSILQDEEGEEKLFSTTEFINEDYGYEQREFGLKSKALGAFAPGAYQAKEAAKYGYDEEDYKKKRGGYALKGLFTPGTATYIKKKVEKMADEGASKEEIRKYLEKDSGKRVAAGVAEALTGAGYLTTPVAQAVGIYDKVTGKRAKSDKKSKSFSEEQNDGESSESKSEKKGAAFKNESSYRGNGRAYFLGSHAGVIGRAVGNHVATKAAEKGASTKEAKKKGRRAATATGAASGVALGGLSARALKNAGLINKKGVAAGIVASHALLGALGANLGAKKAINKRIEKAAEKAED